MIIDLIKLEKSPFNFAAAIAPEAIDLTGAAIKLNSPVEVTGVVTKHILQADVEGEITADKTQTECGRCLSPVERDLKIPFRVSFVEPENYPQSAETELNADDLDVSILEDERIDLTELVREQILLAASETILCREDCRGLCAECGADQNLIDCNCKENEIDPRWQGLRELKVKNEK